MKNTIYTLLALLVLISVACKKEKGSPATVPAAPPADQDTTNGFPPRPFNTFNGVVQINASYLDLPPFNFVMYSASAAFMKEPAGFHTLYYPGYGFSSGSDSVGRLVLNTDTFLCNNSTPPGSYYYHQSSNTQDYKDGVTCSVSGYAGFPAFSTGIRFMPDIDYTASWPSTLSKAQGFNIDFTGRVYYADSIVVSFVPKGSNTVAVRASLPGNTGLTNISLAALGAADTAALQIDAFNYSYLVTQGKTIFFQQQNTYYKQVGINP